MKSKFDRRPWMVVFGAFFVTMTAVTVVASQKRGLFESLRDLWSDWWFRATLADTYLSFMTIYFWVAYKEKTWTSRFIWLVLFLGLGNFAIAGYMLLQLARMRPGDGVEALLLRRSDLKKIAARDAGKLSA